MDVLVCVKRVPMTGGRIVLTEDGRRIETRHLGFTISPHEECAVEEAVRLIEAHGGSTAVLTLGPPEAEEQLRDAMALGVERAILLEAGPDEWGPQATAAAITAAVRAEAAAGRGFDLLLFGNEAADSGDYQVGLRVARGLGLPCVTGVKGVEIVDGAVRARREAAGGWEVFEAPLPAVLTVKEGLNLPRYPSLPGRLKARKKEVSRSSPEHGVEPLRMSRLRVAREKEGQVEVLGCGAEAAPKVVEVLRRIGVLAK